MAKKYEHEFFRDMESLNILAPTIKTLVTDHIPHIINFIQTIMDKGYAYRTPSGTLLLSVFLPILFVRVCFECVGFCFRLSVNGRMTCVRLNCHLAVQKFLCHFYWKWLNGNLARHFKIKKYLYFWVWIAEWYFEWLVYGRIAIWPFTLKRKRKLRDTECTL